THRNGKGAQGIVPRPKTKRNIGVGDGTTTFAKTLQFAPTRAPRILQFIAFVLKMRDADRNRLVGSVARKGGVSPHLERPGRDQHITLGTGNQPAHHRVLTQPAMMRSSVNL